MLLTNNQTLSQRPSKILGLYLTVAALVVLLIWCENKRPGPSLDMVLAQAFSFSTLRNIPLLPQSWRYLEKMEKPNYDQEYLNWPSKHLRCVFNTWLKVKKMLKCFPVQSHRLFKLVTRIVLVAMKYLLENEVGAALGKRKREGKARQGKKGRVEFTATQILSPVSFWAPFLVVAETQWSSCFDFWAIFDTAKWMYLAEGLIKCGAKEFRWCKTKDKFVRSHLGTKSISLDSSATRMCPSPYSALARLPPC